MDVSDVRCLNVLEDENARLKKLLALFHGLQANRCRTRKQMLDNASLKDVAATKWRYPTRSGRR